MAQSAYPPRYREAFASCPILYPPGDSLSRDRPSVTGARRAYRVPTRGRLCLRRRPQAGGDLTVRLGGLHPLVPPLHLIGADDTVTVPSGFPHDPLRRFACARHSTPSLRVITDDITRIPLITPSSAHSVTGDARRGGNGPDGRTGLINRQSPHRLHPSHEVAESHEIRLGGIVTEILACFREDPCQGLLAHLHSISFSCAVLRAERPTSRSSDKGGTVRSVLPAGL